MSLEKNIERIADALEKIANGRELKSSIEKPYNKSLETPKPPEPIITIEDLNKELVETFNRLGDRTKIDNVLKKHGVEKLSDLPTGSYKTVRDEINALN